MDDLIAKFLPRFIALTRERLRRAMETAIDGRSDRAEAAAHDLHALAGEAGLLGLEGVIGLARSAEEAARQFGATGAESDAVTLVDSLKKLERAVSETTAGQST
jgi:HPt (histidine-containing phosphotransfer) domain-containing protein